MAHWIRFIKNNKIGFGQLIEDMVYEYQGSMFDGPEETGISFNIDDVELHTPVDSKNFLGLWNNFFSRAEKEGWAIPAEPLYFSKLASSYTATDKPIVRPDDYAGPVYFEAELGIVIGKTCKQITEDVADEYIFGYTCINDVTALEILQRDKSFPQWVRSKGFDSFCPFGPAIVTGVALESLIIRAILDGETKQEYKISDMVFPPLRLISLLSHYMTLMPGDIIACGTASGSAAMQSGQTIEIDISGIGTLRNIMQG